MKFCSARAYCVALTVTCTCYNTPTADVLRCIRGTEHDEHHDDTTASYNITIQQRDDCMSVQRRVVTYLERSAATKHCARQLRRPPSEPRPYHSLRHLPWSSVRYRDVQLQHSNTGRGPVVEASQTDLLHHSHTSLIMLCGDAVVVLYVCRSICISMCCKSPYRCFACAFAATESVYRHRCSDAVWPKQKSIGSAYHLRCIVDMLLYGRIARSGGEFVYQKVVKKRHLQRA